MVEETEYDINENGIQIKTKEVGYGKLIWNTNTREFCGRDGASWGKMRLCF